MGANDTGSNPGKSNTSNFFPLHSVTSGFEEQLSAYTMGTGADLTRGKVAGARSLSFTTYSVPRSRMMVLYIHSPSLTSS